MKTLLTLIALTLFIITSCSKIEEITPEVYNKQQPFEVHVYYDQAEYSIVINGEHIRSGNTSTQGIDVYPIDYVENLIFYLTKGKRASVTIKTPRSNIEYGYVTEIHSSLSLTK